MNSSDRYEENDLLKPNLLKPNAWSTMVHYSMHSPLFIVNYGPPGHDGCLLIVTNYYYR